MKDLLILLFIVTLAFGAESTNNEAQNIIEGSGYGKSSVTESTLTTIKEDEKYDYTREIIHNFYSNSHTQNIRTESIAKKAEMVKVLAVEQNADKKPADSSDEKTITIKGYCLIKDDIQISKQPPSLSSECETNIGYITLFANLKPENKISTLFVDPVYIEYKNFRYSVKSSFVTNEAKTSYNIATYVNERKLSEVGYQAAISATDEIKTASNQYLLAYEQSRYNQETQIYQNGLTSYPLQSTQYLEPDPLMYAAKAGINLATGVVKSIAEVMKKDLPYLYEIKGGSKIYVDMQVVAKGEKIAGIR